MQSSRADAPADPAPSFQTDQVMTVVGGHFTHDTYSAFLAPLLPLIQEKLSLSYGALGGLAVFMQLPGLLNPFIGYLADKVSLRYFVIFAPAVTATLMSAIGLAPSYLSLVFLLMAAGLSTACFHAPAPAMVAEISGNRVGTGMSLFMAGGELGRTVAPVVAVAAVGWFGLEGLWRLAFVGWAVSGILYVRLRNLKAQPSSKGVLPWARARYVFPPLAWLLVARGLLVGAVTTFLPTFMNDVLGSSLWLAAASLTILEGAGVAGALFAGTLSDRWGRRSVLFVLLAVAPFALFAFLVSPGWALAPLLVVLGFTALSPTPVMLAVVQDEFPENRALANGTYLALNFLSMGLGVWLVGVFADQFGLRAAFGWSGAVALLTLPAVALLPKREG